MAKRDFAHVQSQVQKKNSGSMSAAMAAVSLLLTAILAFSGGYIAGDRHNSTDTLQAEKAALQSTVEQRQKHIAELEQRLAASLEREKPAAKKAAADRVGDLTFYRELPKQKVMPSPLYDAHPAANHAKRQKGAAAHAETASPVTSYRLQVGSFIRRSDAEGLINRMAPTGLNSAISEAQVAGMGTRYRVFAGPFTGMAAAEGAKSLVREKLNITGLLIRE